MTQDFSTNSRAYAVDSLHPNDAGHALLGTTLYRWIKNNITL
jgi:lysophospholipase L1-like esterase